LAFMGKFWDRTLAHRGLRRPHRMGYYRARYKGVWVPCGETVCQGGTKAQLLRDEHLPRAGRGTSMITLRERLAATGVLVVASSCVLLLSAGCSGLSATGQSSTALAAHPDGTGEICLPVDEDGVATVAHEIVTNVSDWPLTVRDIVANQPEIEVLEWTTVPPETPLPGAERGDVLVAGEGSRQVEAGAEVVLVMVLQLTSDTQPDAVPPTVTYEDGKGRSGSLDLTWRVTMMPPGQVC
jgi:hypothetical protein